MGFLLFARKFWLSVPPWIFIGALIILFPIFSFMTYENIHRQKQNTAKLLMEKGAALIRSFEAGTRTGIIGPGWTNDDLQNLLTETAYQSDIAYIFVTDIVGDILAHNDPTKIGQNHGQDLEFKKITLSNAIHYRIIEKNGRKIFEVFRIFYPSSRRITSDRIRFILHTMLQKQIPAANISFPPLIIFVGLDMQAIEEARKTDMRHTIIMASILLLIGSSGIILLFVTQQYRATKTSLRRIKAFSDTVVDHMPIGLATVNHAQEIVMLNANARSILELPVSALLSEPANKLLPLDLWHPVQSVFETGDSYEAEIDCQLQNGKSLFLEVNATLLKDTTDRLPGVMLLFKDLSEIRHLRKEIARSQRLASVGRLAAGVAHEIRNPLSSIKGFSTYFKEKYVDRIEDQKIATLMIQEVDRLNRVVGQLLELARPIKIAPRKTSVYPLVFDSLRLVELQAKTKNISIKTQLDNHVTHLFVDPDHIRQTLLNLYLNAIESMSERGILSVTLRPKDETYAQLQITDTGAGIPNENITHIFDPFFTTKKTGTGLGLAIVHNIMEAHEGQIAVQSSIGKGTQITLLLPIHHQSKKELIAYERKNDHTGSG